MLQKTATQSEDTLYTMLKWAHNTWKEISKFLLKHNFTSSKYQLLSIYTEI